MPSVAPFRNPPTIPYRELSPIERYEPKQTYGLIKNPGDNPWRFILNVIGLCTDAVKKLFNDIFIKHHCTYPGKLPRFLHWIKGSPIGFESLYRCNCGKIYIFRWGKWEERGWYDGGARWLAAGGDLEKEILDKVKKY